MALWRLTDYLITSNETTYSNDPLDKTTNSNDPIDPTYSAVTTLTTVTTNSDYPKDDSDVLKLENDPKV